MLFTKGNVRVLSPSNLIKCITTIEDTVPGWWWSISQYPGTICINLGPGRNCPNPLDVAFSKTDLGDNGFLEEIPFGTDDSEAAVISTLDTLLTRMVPHRNHMRKLHPDLPEHSDVASYRKQTPSNLDFLKERYKELIEKLPVLETDPYRLTNIYLGSCDLSVDCSLRGNNDTPDGFDITIDIKDPGLSIGESLQYAIEELLSDILTPRT